MWLESVKGITAETYEREGNQKPNKTLSCPKLVQNFFLIQTETFGSGLALSGKTSKSLLVPRTTKNHQEVLEERTKEIR